MENNRPVVDTTGESLQENTNYRVTTLPSIPRLYAQTTGADGSIFTVKRIITNYRKNQIAICQLGTNPPIEMTNEVFVFTPVTGGQKTKGRRKKRTRRR
jgi:hypothetical protein